MSSLFLRFKMCRSWKYNASRLRSQRISVFPSAVMTISAQKWTQPYKQISRSLIHDQDIIDPGLKTASRRRRQPVYQFVVLEIAVATISASEGEN